MRLTKLGSKVATLAPRLQYQGQEKPWQKGSLSVARPLSGQQRKRRNDRIKARDKYTCQRCRKLTDPQDLEIDHIIPLFEGGTEQDSNLQSLCAGEDGCHALKSKAERARSGGGPQRRY